MPPAAKLGDEVVAVDTHIVLVDTPDGPVPIPEETPFSGILSDDLSPDVLIMDLPAATVGSIAMNEPDHIPIGGEFLIEPTNTGEVLIGSETVLINGKGAARAGDVALTCNDPEPLPIGIVVAESTVMIGE